MEKVNRKLVTVNGQLGIRITHINHGRITKKTTYSLRKIATAGLLAIGLGAIGVTFAKEGIKEVQLQIEMNEIENLKNAARQMEIMGEDKNTIQIGNDTITISDEIMKLAEYQDEQIDKREKELEEVESLQEKIDDQENLITNIGRQVTANAAKPYLPPVKDSTFRMVESGGTANEEPYIKIEQIKDGARIGSIDLNLNNPSARAINSENIDKIVEEVVNISENGLEEHNGKLR